MRVEVKGDVNFWFSVIGYRLSVADCELPTAD
jgi:hypothetical protein